MGPHDRQFSPATTAFSRATTPDARYHVNDHLNSPTLRQSTPGAKASFELVDLPSFTLESPIGRGTSPRRVQSGGEVSASSFAFMAGSPVDWGRWRPSVQIDWGARSKSVKNIGRSVVKDKDVYLVLAYCSMELFQHFYAPVLYTWERDGSVNFNSITVLSHACSLVLSLGMSLVCKGRRAFGKCWSIFWRFLGISCLFAVADACFQNVSKLNVSFAVYVRIPLAALISSVLISDRRYGVLEWLAIAIMTLSIMTVTYLRTQGKNRFDLLEELRADNFNLLEMLIGSSAGAFASVLAEPIYKNQVTALTGIICKQGTEVSASFAASDRCSAEVDRKTHASEEIEFYIFKMHLDVCCLIMSSVLWVVFTLVKFESSDAAAPSSMDQWFGTWHSNEFVRLAIMVMRGWFVGLVVKRFSTVFRSMAHTLCQVVAVFVIGPVFLGDRGFSSAMLPCTMLVIVIVVAAIVYETGRKNIEHLFWSMQVPYDSAMFHCRCLFRLPALLSNETSSESLNQAREHSRSSGLGNYSVLVLFILSDAGRTLSQQQALSQSAITPGSMVVACFICGVLFASGLTLYLGGYKRHPLSPAHRESLWDRIRFLCIAFDISKVIKYVPCAFFFALSSTLLALAYAQGISPALGIALGYVYMPISALASRFVLGKYYCSLEWLGLLVITLACATFGYLQKFFSESQNPCRHSGGKKNSVLAMLLVIASSVVSVLASLAAERVLKSAEEARLPFYMQKVRLDLASVLCSCVLLFLIGHMSSSPQDAFWKERPLHPPSNMVRYDCRTQSCVTLESDCMEHTAALGPCGSGVFVGWDTWLVWLALAMNVLQGWMTGVVIKQFSTVERAVAQAITIVFIYFFGDPIIHSKNAHNLPLTMVALLIPMSTAVFNIAEAQVEKVVQARQRRDADVYILQFTENWEHQLSAWFQHVRSKDASSQAFHCLVVTTRRGQRFDLSFSQGKGTLAYVDLPEVFFPPHREDFPLMIEYRRQLEPLHEQEISRTWSWTAPCSEMDVPQKQPSSSTFT